MLGDRVKGVRDRMGRPAEAYCDPLGMAQRLGSQLFDFLGESSRKEHGLSFGGDVLEDAFHVRQEAHVEHAIGLVQDENFNTIQMGMTLLDMVQKATGAGDQDLDAVAQGGSLGGRADTAVDGSAAQFGAGPQVLDGFMDLFGEFAGGGDDQGAGLVTGAGQQFI